MMIASESLSRHHHANKLFQRPHMSYENLNNKNNNNNVTDAECNNSHTSTSTSPNHYLISTITKDISITTTTIPITTTSTTKSSCIHNITNNNNNNNNKQMDNNLYKSIENNNNFNSEENIIKVNENEVIVISNNNKVLTIENENFLRKCTEEIIVSAVRNGTERTTKVIDWYTPNELRKLFDFSLRNQAENPQRLFELLKQTIAYSVKTGHPYFVNQLYSGVDTYALIGQWLTDALNPSVYTYEVAPVFTLMEEEVLNEMRRFVGFPNNGYGDGIFCPGGSIANGYAISCARYYKSPLAKMNGLFEIKRQIIFTSEDAHYSIEKLAMFMGIGSANVCKIKTNRYGKMDIEMLKTQIEQSIENNCEPMMVSATAGTTVLGAFDDLNAIAKICHQYKIWMHVDAAWGGGALLSSKYRNLLSGIEKADSVIWNPHKMLTASQQCSTFLTRHKDILSLCHSTNATYLFQKDKFYDTSYDTGDKHIQCGRRADVFKFWFMWKAKGTLGLEAHINQIFKMAEFITQNIRNRSGFELVLDPPECTNVSFWYIPPSLRQMHRNQDYYNKLHKIAPKIKEAMIKKGSMMITYQPLREMPNFFRIVFQNACLSEIDMLYFLDEIESLGQNL